MRRMAILSPCRSLDPAAIDDEVLRAAHPAVVRRQEQRHARDIGGIEPPLETLALVDLAFTLRRHPEAQLAFGHDPTGNHAVDSDVLGPELARERAGEAGDRG